jgi:hypothetical protein
MIADSAKVPCRTWQAHLVELVQVEPMVRKNALSQDCEREQG